MALLWPLSTAGTVLGLVGYVPELWRVLWHVHATPASHLIWALWLGAAACNFAYVASVEAQLWVQINYGMHVAMCCCCMAANAWREWRWHLIQRRAVADLDGATERELDRVTPVVTSTFTSS